LTKFRWGLIGLILGQSVLVTLFRTKIQPPVATHYGLFGPDAWFAGSEQTYWVALSLVILVPLAVLALTTLPRPVFRSRHWWLQAPRTVLIGWLGLSNFLILAELFSNSMVLRNIGLGLNFLVLTELLGYGLWLFWRLKRA